MMPELRMAGGAMSSSNQDSANPTKPGLLRAVPIDVPKSRMAFLHTMRAFVDHPITRLCVALILIVSGFIEAYDTFSEDVSHLRVRIGHGIILLGFMNAFSSLPPVVDGIERWLRLEEAKAERRRAAAENPAVQETTPNSNPHS
jgi:hypothetical protein